MRVRSLFPLAACWVLTLPAVGQAAEQGWIKLFSGDRLDAWRKPGRGWEVVAAVGLDPKNPRRLTAKPGKGVLYNGPRGRAPDLLSKEKFGDVEVHVEFLIPRGSNSGVKLEGLYEIQIYDSAGKKKLSGSDCGGIYPRAELRPTYHHIDDGIPPRTNAARPAGQWQTLDLIFLAPRFDGEGKKTRNARFLKVVLNGKVIHDDVELRWPTGHAWHNKEVPTGPLLLQGDHGPVAFRNVRVRPYAGGREGKDKGGAR